MAVLPWGCDNPTQGQNDHYVRARTKNNWRNHGYGWARILPTYDQRTRKAAYRSFLGGGRTLGSDYPGA